MSPSHPRELAQQLLHKAIQESGDERDLEVALPLSLAEEVPPVRAALHFRWYELWYVRNPQALQALTGALPEEVTRHLPTFPAEERFPPERSRALLGALHTLLGEPLCSTATALDDAALSEWNRALEQDSSGQYDATLLQLARILLQLFPSRGRRELLEPLWFCYHCPKEHWYPDAYQFDPILLFTLTDLL